MTGDVEVVIGHDGLLHYTYDGYTPCGMGRKAPLHYMAGVPNCIWCSARRHRTMLFYGNPCSEVEL